MRPSFALNNHGNCGSCNAESGRNFGMDRTRGGKSTNLAHVVSRNPSLRVLGSKGLTIPANHIAHVFLVAANNQMAGIDATGIVAGVANYCAGRYRAIVQFVTKAVSKHIAPTLVAFAPDAHHAVSVMTLRSSPQPTVIQRSLDDILPKTLVNWAAYPRAIVVSLSKAAFVRFDNSAASTGAANCTGEWVPPRVVTAYIMPWLTLDVTVSRVVPSGDLGFLPTTTVAVTVWNFLRGVLSGMLAHVVSPSKAIGHATGRSLRRGGAFRLTTGVL